MSNTPSPVDAAVARRSARAWVAAGLTLVLGVLLSLQAWHYTAERVRDAEDRDFSAFVESTLGRLEDRLSHYSEAVYSFVGLFAASEQVTRREFHDHYQAMRMVDRFPGLRAVQFVARIDGEARAALEAEVRADTSLIPGGYPGFKVHPPRVASEHAVILYNEPMAGNEPAFGLDLASRPDLFESVRLARDSTQVTASRPFPLIQGGGELIGVVVRAPVYAREAALDTLAQRQEAFRGVASVVFIARDLIGHILAYGDHDRYRVRVLDVGAVWDGADDTLVEPRLVYESPAYARDAWTEPSSSAELSRTYKAVAGRIWAVDIQRHAVAHAWTALPLAVLALCLVTTLTLTGMWGGIGALYARSGRLARQLSRDAVDSARRLQTIMNGTADAIITVDAGGHIHSANDAASRIFGHSSASLLGCEIRQLVPAVSGIDEWRSRHASVEPALQASDRRVSLLGQPCQLMGRRADGGVFPLEITINELLLEGERHFVGIVRDLSEKKAAEEAFRRAQRQLRESDALRHAVFDSAPIMIIATDVNGMIQGINPAAEEALGYSRSELVDRATPAVFHDFEEMAARARQLSVELAKEVQRDASVFAACALAGPADASEWTYLRKDGARFPVRLTISAMRGDDGKVNGFLHMAYDVTEHKRAQANIHHMAHHDALTGLPNRTLLHERIEAAMKTAQGSSGRFGLIFIDLDRFKTINDSLGHHVGDRLLCEISTRLHAMVRHGDTVARMGGDEFVVLMPGIEGGAECENVTQRIMGMLMAPAVIDGHELRITASAGVSIYPDCGQDITTLMRQADAAMYVAKGNGRNQFCMYSQDLGEAGVDRIRMEADLHHALERGELLLHYQPQFDCETGALTGAEALLRWHRGHRVMVGPDEFIALAEETGLIVPIGHWVLREACRQAAAWQGRTALPVGVAVNLSPRQLSTPDWSSDVLSALEETGLAAELLELEITESAVVRDVENTSAQLAILRARGVRVAIDDFGVGYSSLSYLQRLPVDTLKIDRGFVSEIGRAPASKGAASRQRRVPSALGAAGTQRGPTGTQEEQQGQLARALIALAHSLQLRITAEGVEHPHQWSFLRHHGCDVAQGYLLGRPIPLQTFLNSMDCVYEQPSVPAAL